MDKESILSAIQNFKNKKIAVVGDFVLDKYSFGIVERLNPEAAHAILLRKTGEKIDLGCAGNVAANLASLGAETFIFTILGEDYTSIASQILSSKGITSSVVNSGKTIIKERLMSEQPFHYFLRLDTEEKTPSHSEEILNSLLSKISDFEGDAIVLSDYDKGVFSRGFASKVISLAKSKKIPCFVAPKPKNIASFSGADLILPNLKEAKEITENNSLSLPELFSSIKQKTNCNSVIITLSEKGIAVEEEGGIFIAPTRVQKIADVTGAGDTVLALTALGKVSGLSEKDCAHLANYAAGIVIEKIGAATTTSEELIQRISQEL